LYPHWICTTQQIQEGIQSQRNEGLRLVLLVQTYDLNRYQTSKKHAFDFNLFGIWHITAFYILHDWGSSDKCSEKANDSEDLHIELISKRL
jgi:hypothetical protein